MADPKGGKATVVSSAKSTTASSPRRSEASWHRWVTLAMLAYAFLAVTRAQEADSGEPRMVPLTCNEIRHLLVNAIAPA